MSTAQNSCQKCQRKIIPSISNRCMYCGADLPEEHHLDAEQKSQLLADKLAQFKHNEENAHTIISGMRRDFGLPEPKKSREQQKTDNAAALAAALSNLNDQSEGKE
jgi:hypothetical protein